MRKIERYMIAAIERVVPFRSANTEVVIDGTEVRVLLHGNEIASGSTNGTLHVNVDTLRRWPTLTTKSRLRALGFNVTTKGGATYLDGKAV